MNTLADDACGLVAITSRIPSPFRSPTARFDVSAPAIVGQVVGGPSVNVSPVPLPSRMETELPW